MIVLLLFFEIKKVDLNSLKQLKFQSRDFNSVLIVHKKY